MANTRKPLSARRVGAPHDSPSASVRVHTTITLSEALYNKFGEQAIAHGRTCAEEEIQERLTRCQDHVSVAPLYFNDTQRAELERALGHSVITPDVTLAQLRNALRLEVGEIKIELEPRLQARLATRVFRGQTFESMLKREVINGLKRFTGLLPP